MPVLDHSERFQSVICLFNRCTQGCKCISSSREHRLIVINYQYINGFKLHIFPLPVSCRYIESYSKCCSLSLLALTFDRSSDQFYHLLCYGQTKTGSLNAVYAAVHLP